MGNFRLCVLEIWSIMGEEASASWHNHGRFPFTEELELAE